MKLLKRIALTFLVLFMVLLGFPDLLLLPGVLVVGWIPATTRLLGNLPFSGGQICLFLSGCILLVAGLHWFLRLFKGWSGRWTVAIAGTIAFVLLAVMSVVGVAHQFGWILISKEPIFARNNGRVLDSVYLMNTARAFAKFASTNAVGFSPSILYNGHLPDTHDGKKLWEKYNVIFVDPTNAHFAVMWPRDHRLHQQLGSALLFADGEVAFVRSNQPPSTTRAHAANSY